MERHHCAALRFTLRKSWIDVGGGRKSKVSGSIDQFLYEKGWIEKSFQTSIKVDETILDSPTHKVDCYKNEVALEIEWNNKDPFFDRDLNNLRLLFDLRAISVGVIITVTIYKPSLINSGAATLTVNIQHTCRNYCRASKAEAGQVAPF